VDSVQIFWECAGYLETNTHVTYPHNPIPYIHNIYDTLEQVQIYIMPFELKNAQAFF